MTLEVALIVFSRAPTTMSENVPLGVVSAPSLVAHLMIKLWVAHQTDSESNLIISTEQTLIIFNLTHDNSVLLISGDELFFKQSMR